jgi:hypothetical protein
MTQSVMTSFRQSDGSWAHTGRLEVRCKLDSGAVVMVTLPDDWQALVNRVAALEASSTAVPNSLEDLRYAG